MRAPTTVLPAYILFFAVITTKVSAQVENLPWGVERIGGDFPWDEDRDLIVDFQDRVGNGTYTAVIDR